MAYESRIYIVEEPATTLEIGGKKWCNQLATLNLSRCDDGFVELFTTESPYYIEDDNQQPVVRDLYGGPLKMATAREVMAWLEPRAEKYRRYAMALSLLESICSAWDIDKVAVVHYGY